ncbi:hypothetical protein [Pleomorphomonas koreensis]|uniref:hypothetical protein n=1 Tax=Pleomorphomonas koreensis TaxID=257440 RepID=UPI0004196B0A|nr:hypothetical protein [Pleomorphomonas koreensis]
MAHRVEVLRDWDFRAKLGVIVAFKAGQKVLATEAAWKAAPEGVFQEVQRDGKTRKP